MDSPIIVTYRKSYELKLTYCIPLVEWDNISTGCMLYLIQNKGLQYYCNICSHVFHQINYHLYEWLRARQAYNFMASYRHILWCAPSYTANRHYCDYWSIIVGGTDLFDSIADENKISKTSEALKKCLTSYEKGKI